MAEEKLTAKLFISGKINAITGLHIGGSSTTLDIGGIDSNVIKTANGVPFIPGSSLKGKIRCLLEIREGMIENCKDPSHPIANIFGASSSEDKKGVRTRLVVRDAFLNEEDFAKKFADAELELEYSESKWENTIDRLTSSSKNLRQLERVPSGALFDYEMVYTIFNDADVGYLKTLLQGMRLLEDDYLGGSGSRGYGKVRFEGIKFEIKTGEAYSGDNQRQLIATYSSTDDFDFEKLIKEVKKQTLNGKG